MPRLALPLAFAAVCAAAPLAAQQVAGSITGTLGLDDAVWHVRDGGEAAPRSTWTGGTEAWQLRIAGYPTRTGSDPEGALVLDIDATGTPEQVEVGRAEVRMLTKVGEDWIATGKNVDFSLTGLARNGEDLAVAGSFTARMSRGGAEGLVLADEDTMAVDGNFQATLAPRPERD